ncbi:MAG: agmatine deiminase family protein, partial [Proteobacteria bacterium]|nr:agmatine deiminase family protein [Pseudomonadota bacterium]
MLSKYEDKVVLPAEWEPQSTVLIAWPFRDSDWKEKFEDVEKNYLALCKAICTYQKVLILCKNDEHRDSIKNKLELAQLDNNTYSLIIADYNDTWCR